MTSGVQVEDSSVKDPFLGIDRRLRQAGRGSFRLGYRHDLSGMSLNYGFNYNHGFKDNRKAFDVDKWEDYNSGDFMTTFVETVGFMGLTSYPQYWCCRCRASASATSHRYLP